MWSAIDPKDRVTWYLEVAPALIALVAMAVTWQRFQLTPLSYWLILLHSIILMVGGHYTYAEVPLFDTLTEIFDWQRNNYDKVGHFAQGFIPVVVARELLIRLAVVNGKVWTDFLAISFCLAFSAFYELIEWAVALASEESAEAFLGTQGYVWDTQSDMGWCLLGAIVCVLVLGRVHQRQIDEM